MLLGICRSPLPLVDSRQVIRDTVIAGTGPRGGSQPLLGLSQLPLFEIRLAEIILCVGKRRTVREAGELLDSRFGVSREQIQPCQIVLDARVVAGLFLQAFEFFSRLRDGSNRKQANGELVSRPDEPGIEGQRRLKFFCRFLIFVVFLSLVAPTHMSFRRIGLRRGHSSLRRLCARESRRGICHKKDHDEVRCRRRFKDTCCHVVDTLWMNRFASGGKSGLELTLGVLLFAAQFDQLAS